MWVSFLPWFHFRLTQFRLKTGFVGLFLTLVLFQTHSIPAKNRYCGSFNQVPNHFFEVIFFEIKFEITVFEIKSLSRLSFRSPRFRRSRYLYSRLQSFPYLVHHAYWFDLGESSKLLISVKLLTCVVTFWEKENVASVQNQNNKSKSLIHVGKLKVLCWSHFSHVWTRKQSNRRTCCCK